MQVAFSCRYSVDCFLGMEPSYTPFDQTMSSSVGSPAAYREPFHICVTCQLAWESESPAALAASKISFLMSADSCDRTSEVM